MTDDGQRKPIIYTGEYCGTHLRHHKLALALVANLQKRFARHVLHPRVRLVHKLKELVDHRLEKLPVVAQKAGVLADDIHDVGGHHCLVVLAAGDLTQVEQVPAALRCSQANR